MLSLLEICQRNMAQQHKQLWLAIKEGTRTKTNAGKENPLKYTNKPTNISVKTKHLTTWGSCPLSFPTSRNNSPLNLEESSFRREGVHLWQLLRRVSSSTTVFNLHFHICSKGLPIGCSFQDFTCRTTKQPIHWLGLPSATIILTPGEEAHAWEGNSARAWGWCWERGFSTPEKDKKGYGLRLLWTSFVCSLPSTVVILFFGGSVGKVQLHNMFPSDKPCPAALTHSQVSQVWEIAASFQTHS